MDPINPIQRLPDSNGSQSLNRTTYLGSAPHPHATVELLRYLKLLFGHARLIVGVTLGMMVLSVLINEFVTTRLYQAQAVITPVPPDQDMNLLGGGLQDMLGGGGGGLASMLMGTSDNELVSQRYIAILNSFDFTNNLVKRYNLATYLFSDGGADAAKATPWKIYQLINGSFETDYDYKSGNLSLTFIDSSRERARQVLTWYLEALRERLRNQDVQSAAIAAKSLEDEIAHTSDSLLQSQLYELLARQIQREKLSQVEADFAFKVIEPPVVPDAKYSPHVKRGAIILGLLTLLVTCVSIIVWEWLSHAHAHLNAGSPTLVPLVDPIDRDETRLRESAMIGSEKIRLQR